MPSMTNDAVYEGGLLNLALDPRSQPDSIRAFLAAEEALVRELVPDGGKVVDIGCGTGRHLIAMAARLSFGVGVDYEQSYVAEAARQARGTSIHFLVADAAAVPLDTAFDRALCLTNTWGTMSDKAGVLREMRRLSPAAGTRLLTVYTSGSIDARIQWYANVGHDVVEVTDECVVTTGGFTSEHFTEQRIGELVGSHRLRPIGDIAWLIET
jgi:ubiquinone/menaquinone biosynthesis C-methylase UbiE